MKKKLITILCALLALFLLCGCAGHQSSRPIDNIDDLEGRRVGVGLAWAADFLLTGREDMTLMRYGSIADMVTALSYQRLDAIAVERPYSVSILAAVEGLREVEPVIARTGLAAYVANGREDVLEQFNAFARDFRQTGQYADLDRRLNGEEPFAPVDVPLSGDGPALRIAICSGNYPFVYVDFLSGEYVGSDIEYIKHFANACNYTPEFIDGDYTSMELSVAYGRADMAFSGLSDLYRADTERSGRAMVTDPYMENDVVLLEVAEPGRVKVVSSLDI